MAGDATALNVVLTANFKRLEQDLKKAGLVAGEAVDDIEKKFAKARPQLSAGFAGGLAGGLVGGITGQIENLISKLAQANAELVELGNIAKRTGTDAGRIQEIQYAGGKQGISRDATAKAYDEVGRAIDKATQSETEFGRLLAVNGVQLKDSKGQVIETSAAFDKLANLVANAKTEYQKEQILQIAGISKEMVPLFEQGAEAIARQGEEARAVGAIVGDEVIAKAAEFQSKWDTAVQAFRTYFMASLGDISKEIQDIVGYAEQLANIIPGLAGKLKEGVSGINSPAGFLSDVHKIMEALGFERASNAEPEARPLTIRRDNKGGTKLPPPKGGSGGGGGGGLSEEDRRYNQVVNYIEQLEKVGRILDAEIATIGKSNAERAKAIELARIGNVTDAEQLDLINKQVDANERKRQVLEAAKRAQKGMNDAAQFAGQELLGAFESLLDGGKIEDAINGITKALMKAALQAAILGQGPLANLFGSASTTGGPGGLIGSLLGAFGGARASGGPVQAGKTYLVGENGPEMVRFGKNGSVMPNGVLGGRGGGGGGVNVQVINQSQAQVGQPEVSTGPDGRMMLRMLIREEVTGDVAKNGPIAQMFQGRYGMNRSGGRR